MKISGHLILGLFSCANIAFGVFLLLDSARPPMHDFDELNRALLLSRELEAKRQQMEADLNAAEQRVVSRSSPNSPAKDPRHRPTKSALTADPEYIRLRKLGMRPMLDRQYAALFRQLALSSDELAMLKDILIERDFAKSDAVSVAHEQGFAPPSPSPNDPVFIRVTAPIDEKMRAVFGEDVAARVLEFEQKILHRNEVNVFATRARAFGIPISEEKISQLTNVLSDFGELRQLGIPPIWPESALSRASSILTADEHAFLKRYQLQQQSMSRMLALASKPAK